MNSSGVTEQDGRYTIKVVQQKGEWLARVFRDLRPVTSKVEAPDRAAALQAARTALAEHKAARRDARGTTGIPSADEYREAFTALSPLAANDLKMLKAHLKAPDHLITATQLASAAGYATWSAANLRYGQLARRLAEELDYDPERREDGSPIWTGTLASWALDGDLDAEQGLASLVRHADNPHFEWLMRPEVREAVRDL